MGNIGSQSGYLKYKPTNPENPQWAHSFPRTQTRFQQNQLKVLPDKTPKIRLRHTENGEILQTGGTLTGRQIQSKLGDAREIKKCGSEPHLHTLMNSHHSDSFESEKERKFRKKYRAPPPPNKSGKFNESTSDYWDNRKETLPKPRLFKTRIQSERKRSAPEYQEKSDYFDPPEGSLDNVSEEEKVSYLSHRLSLPALNTTAWDFQGELKEATRRLRKVGTGEEDAFLSSHENISEDASTRNKLKTLDHHIDKNDLLKLKSGGFIPSKHTRNNGPIPLTRSEASGKESSIEEPSPKMKMGPETKSEAPKPFYFGMSSSHQSLSIKNNDSKVREKNYPDSESSTEMKRNDYDFDPRSLMQKKSKELSRFSPVSKWKQTSSAESVMNAAPFKESKYSSEENEEPPRIFSIFPARSRSNDRSRSGDSGISGDGSPTVYEDTSEPFISLKNKLQSSQTITPSWTPQQDLGDDSSFEEESLSAGDYTEPFETQSIQRHVFSLSLPRDHHLASYANSDQNLNETNFDKIKRSVSGILNNINKREAESTPENERGNWFLNKSCSALDSSTLNMNYPQLSDEVDEFSTRNTKLNSGRLMYLPKPDKPIRPRRYETRNRQKSLMDEKLDRNYTNNENVNESKSMPVPESLQDSPKINDRKTFKKKPKRFTFQSTIRQIERRRIAEKLSREAEKKEQQRLRELEVMQKVEREFQRKRAREKVNIKQQLSRYSYANVRSNSSPDFKLDIITTSKDVFQARSEPDGAASSSPTSSLSQLDPNKQEETKYYKKANMDYVNNNSEYKSYSDTSDDNRSKPIMQTQILSEYKQPQREYRDYQSSKKHLSDRVDSPRQTTIHPKVTYKMPNSKATSRYGSNNYRKDFAYGIKTKSEASLNQQFHQTKSSPNKYYSQFGPLTRF